MGSLSVRKLEDEIIQKLRVQAANHGVSMEEEVRHILSRAVAAPERISDIFLQHFGAKHGIVLKEEKQSPHEPMDFEA